MSYCIVVLYDDDTVCIIYLFFYVAMSTVEDDLSKTDKLFRFYRPKKVKLSRVFESRIFTELIIAMKKFRKTKFRYAKVKG